MSLIITENGFAVTPPPVKTMEQKKEISTRIERRFAIAGDAGPGREPIRLARLCRRCWSEEKNINALYCSRCVAEIARIDSKADRARRAWGELQLFLQIVGLMTIGFFIAFAFVRIAGELVR